MLTDSNLDYLSNPDYENNQEDLHRVGLRRVHIENVQSIKDLTLDFEQSGVYRLVGGNDVGKSAILRAINALFHNVSRNSYKEYISDWADTFVVEAWFYDGGYVKLSRGTEDFYEWSLPESNNIVYKTDGKVPAELQEYFNLYFEQDKSKITLNMNLQGDILPFVDSTTSNNYWLLQKALGTNDFLKASKYLKDETNVMNREIKRRVESIDKEVLKSEQILTEIRSDENDLSELTGLLKLIEEEKEEYDILEYMIESSLLISQLKQALQSIPYLSEAEIYQLLKQSAEHELLEKFYQNNESISLSNSTLDKVNRALQIFETEQARKELVEQQALTNLFNTFSTYQKLKQDLTQTDSKLVQLDVKDSTDLLLQTDLLKKLFVEQANIQKNKDYLQTVQKKIFAININELRSEQLVIDTFTQLLVTNNTTLQAKTKISDINERLESLDKEIQELKNEQGVCPVCGSDMTKHAH